MKRIFLSAIAAMLLLTACEDKKDGANDGGNGNSKAEKMKKANRVVLDGIKAGDGSKMGDIIAKDAVDHGGNPDGSDLKGGDSIIAMLSRVKSGFTDLNWEVKSEAVDGDQLFVLVQMTGTTNATPVWGMPANTKIDATSIDYLKFNADGKISDHWAFMSPADMMKMMQSMGPGNTQPTMVKDTIKK